MQCHGTGGRAFHYFARSKKTAATHDFFLQNFAALPENTPIVSSLASITPTASTAARGVVADPPAHAADGAALGASALFTDLLNLLLSLVLFSLLDWPLLLLPLPVVVAVLALVPCDSSVLRHMSSSLFADLWTAPAGNWNMSARVWPAMRKTLSEEAPPAQKNAGADCI